MTHRVYLRRSDQSVSHKTTTDLESVARFAFEELKGLAEAVGADVAWTEDGVQRGYLAVAVARQRGE